MNYLPSLLAFVMALLLVGCADEVPQQAKQESEDASKATVDLNKAVYTSTLSNGDRSKTSDEYKSGHVTLFGSIEAAEKADADSAQLTFTIEPSNGWHVYAHEKSVPKGAIGRPTLIVVDAPDGFAIGKVKPDQDVIEKEDDILKTVIRYHKGTVTWNVPIKVSKPLPSGEYEITGWVGFQACADDDSSCDMPAAAKFVIPFRVGGDNDAEASFEEAKYKEVSEAASKQADEEDK